MDTATVAALLLGLAVGLGLGGVAAWLLAGARAQAKAAEAARAASDASAMLRADAAGARAERTGLQERVSHLDRRLADAEERLRRAESEAASATASLRSEREGASRLTDTFAALSADALARNNEQFVALAEGRIKEATASLRAKADGDTAAGAAAIGRLLDPMASALQRVEGQLRDVEKDRQSAYAGLREQVSAMAGNAEALQSETKQLVNALRAPQTRGRWGEMQLERVVQYAGMVEHCDFGTQVVANTPDGGVRPDLVVHLAGGKNVVVDAKVPFAAYLEAVEATDHARHRERLTAHARQLRTHVDQLSAKTYWEAFEPSPEFVVLFVPGDSFLEAALQADPSVLEYAFGSNVVIATPTTLIALLRTVGYTWKQEALARNAAQVHQLGRELHGRLATMGTHVAKLGRSLDTAVSSYNQTVSSLEARVLVTARKLTELKVSDTELPEQMQVERAPRTISAPELVASAADSLIALHEVTREDSRFPREGRGATHGGDDGSRASVNG